MAGKIYQPLLRSTMATVAELQLQLIECDGRDFYLAFFLKDATIDKLVKQLNALKQAKASEKQRMDQEEKEKRKSR